MQSDYAAESQRLTQQLIEDAKEIRALTVQRDMARMEAQRLKEQLEGMETQLSDIYTGKHLSVSGDHISVDGLAFSSGSDRLNQAAAASLQDLARQINSTTYTHKRIVVVGHTDDTPIKRHESQIRYGDNWGLSALRAASVVRALIDAGVKPERISGGFQAHYAPVASNSSEQNRSSNRRVEIFLQ
jgi:chemotaxis protein MotB